MTPEVGQPPLERPPPSLVVDQHRRAAVGVRTPDAPVVQAIV
jgi:hypothetical protein